MKSQLDGLFIADIFNNTKHNDSKEFDEIVTLATEICGTALASIILSDNENDYLIANIGFDIEVISKEISFFNQATIEGKRLLINDTALDAAFTEAFPENTDPVVRFCAGIPLQVTNGTVIGSLLVMDTKPKTLSQAALKTLELLSQKITNIMELELSNKLLSEQLQNVENQKKALDNISIVLSHEFRGPVCSLMGLINIIRDEGYNPPEEYIKMMEDAVQALDQRIHLIEDFTHTS